MRYFLSFFLFVFCGGICEGQTISPAGTATYCAGGAVTLTVSGAANNSNFQWKRDGNNIAGANQSNISASLNGNYTVVITPGSAGTPDTLGPIVVSSIPRPVVDFTFTPNNACSGANVVFTSNVSSGTPGYSYDWDFDDGGTSTNANPVHAFTSLGCNTGTFNVKLTVTDSKGCSNVVTKTVNVKQAPIVEVTDPFNITRPFSNCQNNPSTSNPNYTITVNNISPNASCISSYSIDWGDGTPIENNITFPINHTYTQLGAFEMKVAATGTNGCTNTKKYIVANQKNPDIGIGTFGLTEGCANLPINIVITTWTLNSPGTTYLLEYGDGNSTSFNHPINTTFTNDTISHLYTTTSCPNLPVYTLKITATNACRTKSFTGGDIVVKTKPQADFTIQSTPTCNSSNVCFTHVSTSGYDIDCNTLGSVFWNFGDPSSGANNTSTLLNPCHTYNAPGTYLVSLTDSNICGPSKMVKQVCVTGPPAPGFTLDTKAGCLPLIVNATDTTNTFGSCQSPTYKWVVTYTPAFCGTSPAFTYINGTSDTSANPRFSFTNSGTYTLTQRVTNVCGTFISTNTVDVKQPPKVNINLPTYNCGIVTLTPAQTVTNCGTGSLTYVWTFTGGTPASATTANPGMVSFTTLGPHPISLAVTNECGTTTAVDTVIVSTAPNVVSTADINICGGLNIGPINFTSTIGTPNYSWTNSNPSIGLAALGTGNIASFTAINNGTTPITATIIVSPFVSICTGIADTFLITVNPKPSAPVVSTPVVYCQNELAVALTATATGSNTLMWYNNAALTGGSTTAPIPNTITANNTSYYVTQTNATNCVSAAAVINVIVHPLITGNVINASQNICAGTAPNPFTSSTVFGGDGVYSYQWQSSIDGIVWLNISGANTSNYTAGVLTDTIQYRRIVQSAMCTDTSNNIVINVAGALSNVNIAAGQTICQGFAPALLSGGLPLGGGGFYNYVWESSTDNVNWTSVASNTQNYQPPILNTTTYFRRITNASQCSATSNVVTISVNPTPIVSIAAVNSPICTYDTAKVIFLANTGSAPFNIELVVTKPNLLTDTIRLTINNNGPFTIPVFLPTNLTGNYTIELFKTIDNNGCIKNAVVPKVSIVVNPLPILTLTNSSPICNGVVATLAASGASTYLWSPNTNINTITGPTVQVSPTSTTTYFVRGTLNGCFKDTSTIVTVIPGATIANAGVDQLLCNLPSTVLAANQASVNATGSWSQIAGPATTIANATLFNTNINGMQGGNTYRFVWTITGQAPCPPTTDTVAIHVLSPIINTIKNDTTICNGQSVTLLNAILNGGSATAVDSSYTYQWQFSTPSLTSWQNIIGADSATLLVSPNTSTCYRRLVKSNALCETVSNVICVTVNPTISNNNISANQQICVNTPVNNVVGSLPNGGNGTYVYQWQTSTDGVSWSNIVNTISYQPPTYLNAGIHYFRRNVTSGNCTNASNVITITVHPDSKAIFTSSPIINCAPFNLSTAISVTALPDSNGTYNWYANGLFFGSNSTGVFPGYTILNADDTVLIKLVTNSQFGCKPDSIAQQFVTVKTAQAAFIKDKLTGCGPLAVSFTNTSNILNSTIQYFWDFGNGITSTALQPGSIVFNTSPFFNDTTYYITLKAYNGCDTTLWKDSVKVRANPNARFGVVSTFGCSPFTVQINNTSLGGPNTYYWDFGNGHKDTTSILGALNYTYNIGNVVDTFPIQLIAVNECGSDTQVINIRIAPNIIRPLVNINASDLFGCAPHIVAFSNATTGATSYTWDFGDGSGVITTNNTESTVLHTFNTPGNFTVTINMTNGCSDTVVTRQVTVFAKPQALFTTNATTYCLGDTIKVNNTSTNATNYRWFWGDGQTSAGQNPVHVYAVAGNYTILLRAEKTNSSGIVCFDTIAQSITVLVRPNVTVQSNISTVNCAPFTLNVSAPAIINESVVWYITDTTVNPSSIQLTGINAQYIFNKPGTFSVKMVAENALGCKDSTSRTFTVKGTPIATFSPNNLSVCVLDTTVNYSNTSTYNDNGPITYRWLVDGVQLSANGNFTHRYQVSGSAILPKLFTTQLIVTNTVGCSDTAVGVLQVNPTSKAQFSISNTNACTPFIVNVTNNSTNASTYTWLLNGALVDTIVQPVFAIPNAATNYTIALIANNIYGCRPDTFTASFRTRIKPVAAFTVSDTLGCTGFLNIATFNRTINATTYSWNWGDGSANSTFANPTYLYNTLGQYVITLIASDGTCVDTAFQPVYIGVKPVVSFDVNNKISCDTARVQFINQSTGSNVFNWYFSDGSTSTDINPAKSFSPSVSPYTVKLVATGSFGCKDSLTKPNMVTAIVPPRADFFISPTATITVPNFTFSFNNLTQGSTKYLYQWDLADGTFSANRDVTHKYADTGNYPIQLIVLDTSTNCPDTIVKIARIDGFPGWLYVPNAICPNCIQSNVRAFIPKGKGLQTYQLQIFTTWGELVFETTEIDATGAPTKPWDGRYKGMPVQQDVYVWKIFARFMNGSEWQGMLYPGEAQYKKTGTITVVR